MGCFACFWAGSGAVLACKKCLSLYNFLFLLRKKCAEDHLQVHGASLALLCFTSFPSSVGYPCLFCSLFCNSKNSEGWKAISKMVVQIATWMRKFWEFCLSTASQSPFFLVSIGPICSFLRTLQIFPPPFLNSVGSHQLPKNLLIHKNCLCCQKALI